MGLDIQKETDIFAYLDNLSNNLKNRIVVISAKDTPGMAINQELQNKLQNIGVKTKLTDKHWCGYCAIIKNGKSLKEKCAYDKTVSLKLDDVCLSIFATSSPLNAENNSSVRVNSTEYSVNSRGLNIVVIDNITGKVVDSVSFDTHHPAFPCKRK